MNSDIFVSHSSKDDGVVMEVPPRPRRPRVRRLGGLARTARRRRTVDSRDLRGGAKLAPEIERRSSRRASSWRCSARTLNSPWVRKEIQKRCRSSSERKGDGYRVIPLLLPGIEPAALPLWFDEEPVAVPVRRGRAG